MNEANRAQESFATLLASIALKLLRIGFLGCRICVLYGIVHGGPHVPVVLRRLALLGAALCLAFEFVLPVPEFPFWSAMQLPIICAALLVLHRVLVAGGRDG